MSRDARHRGLVKEPPNGTNQSRISVLLKVFPIGQSVVHYDELIDALVIAHFECFPAVSKKTAFRVPILAMQAFFESINRQRKIHPKRLLSKPRHAMSYRRQGIVQHVWF